MNEAIQRFLAQHLVSLSGYYSPIAFGKPTEDRIPFAFSGTVIAFRGKWFFLTAGHVIEDLDRDLKAQKFLIRQAFLVDSFGYLSTSNIPIPFTYDTAGRAFLFEDGLDFGLIALDSNTVKLLQANGIKAITREHWINQEKAECSFYWMIGLPREIPLREDSKKENIGFSIAIVPLDKIDPPPDIEQTQFPRFVAKIGDDCKLKSIDGMSGGPILGFTKDAKIYWIVAIQSKWLPTRRIIFACPMKILGELVEKSLDFEL